MRISYQIDVSALTKQLLSYTIIFLIYLSFFIKKQEIIKKSFENKKHQNPGRKSPIRVLMIKYQAQYARALQYEDVFPSRMPQSPP